MNKQIDDNTSGREPVVHKQCGMPLPASEEQGRKSLSAKLRSYGSEGYTDKIKELPLPGFGGGFHRMILGVANCGLQNKVPVERIRADIRGVADRGVRGVPDSEINDAIEKACRDLDKGVPRPSVIPRNTLHSETVLPAILERGRSYTESDLRRASPVAVDWPHGEVATRFLQSAYDPLDLLFIGSARDSSPSQIRTVHDWCREGTPGRWPHMIPNPLTGLPGPLKSDPDKTTLRGDACVALHKYVVLEFDEVPPLLRTDEQKDAAERLHSTSTTDREEKVALGNLLKWPRTEQLAFWCGCTLPVGVLVDSAGKSVHAWVRVDIENALQWREEIIPLFKTHLGSLGFDTSCSNASRLSRMPGHLREQTGQWQQLIFLDPDGRGPLFYLKGGLS